MKVAIAGGNLSTLITLKSIIKHKLNVVGVLGYEPKSIKNVSGYARLDEIARSNNIEYVGFQKINSSDNVSILRKWAPDIFFVVGLSQLVAKELLQIPKLGTIGFHPTSLPKGRGRAPIAWLILEKDNGAANFFLMDDGVDSGPIFISEPFKIYEEDYAEDVEKKIMNSIEIALDKWLPKLKKGIWDPKPQDEAKASYYGKRAPIDGWINWHDDAVKILRLIKASSRPHPGAFTFYKDMKLIVWRADLENDIKIKGVPSRILLKDFNRGLLVQTGDGLIWLEEIELLDFNGKDVPLDEIKVGSKLGYNFENELFKLKNILKQKGIL